MLQVGDDAKRHNTVFDLQAFEMTGQVILTLIAG